MDRPLFSDILAERRRELGYSIGQAARVLRLKEEVLIAFEQGDLAHMPKGGYATGMLSSYARYLGLDPNEVTQLYQEDLKAYESGGRHRSTRGTEARSSRGGATSTRPQRSRDRDRTRERSRDSEGSFDTTRVRHRASANYDEEENLGGSDRQGYSRMSSSRPYTARRPSAYDRTQRDGSYYTDASDIQYRNPRDYGYEDDLHIGRAAQSYESASTRSGRRTRGAAADTQRPRRSQTSRQRSQDRRVRQGSARQRRGSTSRGGTAVNPLSDILERVSLPFVGIVVVVIVLTAVLALSITSCIRQDSESARSVPVSTVQDSSQEAKEDTSTDKATTTEVDEAGALDEVATDSSSSGRTTDAEETSVSVSVLDGAVTWLEVECDGQSDVAQTITGPWQRTYTVEDSLTVEVGDTTAVAVVQNGRQVQFDSITSGVGTLRIQGTKKAKSDDDAEESDTQSDDEELADGTTYDPEQDL